MSPTESSSPTSNFPTVSVVIPSLHGESENLDRLSNEVLDSGIPRENLEILVAVEIRPNGRARDAGVLYASGEYLIFMDDDVSFPDPVDLKRLIEFLEEHESVGLAGPAQQIPPDTPEVIQERAHQMPRSHQPVTDTFVESDMVTHACMAIAYSTFLKVGMEHPNLISGTDPDLRHRLRRTGRAVGIVPGTRVYHPPISGWTDLVQKNFRGGRRSRAVQRNYKDHHLSAEPTIQSTEDSHSQDSFIRKVSNHGSRMLSGVLGLKVWWIVAQVAYLTGYLSEVVLPTRKVDPIPYPDPPSSQGENREDFIEALRKEGTVKRLHPNPTDTPSLRLRDRL